MIADLLRLIEAENAKRKRKTAAQAKKDREVEKEVAKEVNQKLVSIRKEKKKNKTTTPPPKPKPVIDLKVGDKVRMVDGKSVGSIDSIEKQKAIVNYGLFTTQVSLDQLEIAN